GLDHNAIAVVELASGTELTRRDIASDTSATPIGPPGFLSRFDTSAIALSEDGTTLAFASSDGFVHVLDASTLAVKRDPIASGLVVLNSATYLPTTESPVALSPDGSVLAYVDPSGAIGLFDLVRGTAMAALASPLPAQG